MGIAQSQDGLIEFVALTLEMVDLGYDLLGQKTQFQIRLAGLLVARGQHLVNFRQRETELFAFEDHFKVVPVTPAIIANGSLAMRMEKTTVLIKPERPDADAKVSRHVTNAGKPLWLGL